MDYYQKKEIIEEYNPIRLSIRERFFCIIYFLLTIIFVFIGAYALWNNNNIYVHMILLILAFLYVCSFFEYKSVKEKEINHLCMMIEKMTKEGKNE